MIAVRHALVHQRAQQLTLHHDDLHARQRQVRMRRINFHVRHHAAFIHRQIAAQFIALHVRISGVHDGDVRAAVLMIRHKLRDIRVVDDVGVAQHQIFLLGAGEIVGVGAQRIQHTRVHANILARQERRQHLEAVILPVQIPLLAGADVIHQGVIILLHDDADVLDAAVDHRGQQEVNDAVATAHRQRRDGAGQGQLAQIGVIFAGVDNTHYVFHFLTSFPLL